MNNVQFYSNLLLLFFFLTGTGDWTEFADVLDVPEDAVTIAFGILLSG